MLTLANVRVNVVISSDKPQSLSGTPIQYGHKSDTEREWLRLAQNRLRSRDWRKLRRRLIRLDLESSEKIAASEWLNDAGYVPEAASPRAVAWRNIFDLDRDPLWTPADVTPDVVAWLHRRRDVIAWLMTKSENSFRKAVSRAWEYSNHKQNFRAAIVDAAYYGKKQSQLSLSKPANDFLLDLRAPTNLDPELLERFLTGAGRAPNLHALLHWFHGDPTVTIYADTPVEAIGFSIHVDRNFSKRRWVKCKCRCGNSFERERSTDRFYSTKCRNNFITTERRRKIKLLEQGRQAWERLPAAKRKQHNWWKWIAGWAKVKSKWEFDPAWVLQTLSKRAAQPRNRKLGS
jgi:hypothetical protein